MIDDLLPYYNRELSFFRRLSAEFAEANPKIAARLRIGADSSEDPHVERLIEAFAFLNARTRMKLEDDFPEVSDALLGLLYPHYLAPIPSMAIVQYHLDPTQSSLKKGYVVPPQAAIATEAIQGEPCLFRSAYPVTLWPISLKTAGIQSRPYAAPTTVESRDAVAVLRLSLTTLADDLKFSGLSLESLRFYLKGVPQLSFALYELLMNHVIQIAIARSPTDPEPVLLSPKQIQPVGFAPEEGLLPYGAQSALGYRLLTEYFAFPQKFLFVDLNGFGQGTLAGFDRNLEIYIYLNKTTRDLEQNVDVDTFRMGCTPMVNLFRQRAEPIALTGRSYEYRVVPDARRPLAKEVYSIQGVAGISPAGERVEFTPFYSYQHGSSSRREASYWHASRRPAETHGDEVDQGTDVYLSLVDLNQEPIEANGWFLDVETICLNRDLPGRLPFGGGQPRLSLSEGHGPVKRVECLTAPTQTMRPAQQKAAMWRLISHLSLGHLSIVDGPQGAAALREILSLYDFRESAETRAIIDGILSVNSQRTTARVPGEFGGVFCRGVEATIEFDPARYSENGLFLFASVLERFLALYCTVNSFSVLVARVKGREEPLRRWLPRAGEQVLL